MYSSLQPIILFLNIDRGNHTLWVQVENEREREWEKLTLASVSCTNNILVLRPTKQQDEETVQQFSFLRRQQVSLHGQQYAFRRCTSSVHLNGL